MRSMQMLRILTLLGVVALGSTPSPSLAGELLPALGPFHRFSGRLHAAEPAADWHPTATSRSFYHHEGRAGVVHSAWYGQAMGVPTYNWGYFGVNPRPYSVTHGSYYGYHQEWGIRRGF